MKLPPSQLLSRKPVKLLMAIISRRAMVSAFAALLLLAPCSGCSSGEPSPEEATPNRAPNFQAIDLRGNVRSLQTYRGRTVLLTFWATWCSVCASEMEALKQVQRKLEPYGLMVVAIAIDDTADRVEIFAREHKLNFPILVDQGGYAKAAYEVQGLPEAFIINPKGRLLTIADPETGEASDRISGPQEWDSQESVAALLKLLQNQR